MSDVCTIYTCIYVCSMCICVFLEPLFAATGRATCGLAMPATAQARCTGAGGGGRGGGGGGGDRGGGRGGLVTIVLVYGASVYRDGPH